MERLRWSNHQLTYYVRDSAEATRANAELIMPDICEEATAIVVSRYRHVPPSMAQYERQENAANSKIVAKMHSEGSFGDPDQMILRMLEPYERPDEKALIPHEPTTQQLEKATHFLLSSDTELIYADCRLRNNTPDQPAPS